jgi:EmrB/QacA subfamily drug resistance transporter
MIDPQDLPLEQNYSSPGTKKRRSSAQDASRNTLALAAVCLSALMLGLEISSVPAILPILERVLPAGFRQLQWIMNAYTVAMTTCLMAMGALADRFGRRRVFLIGIAAFGAASLACGLAPGAPVLIAARALQGASAAAMLSCQIAVLSHQFPAGPGRGRAFGWWGIVFGFGLGFGPLVGGLTAALLSWDWVFLVHVLLALATLALARAGVAESSDPQAVRLDGAGIATLSVTVFSLVYLITRGQALRPDDPVSLLAGLGAAGALAFVMVELRATRPMFDFAAFRNRRFSGALIGSAAMNFSFWPFVIYLPIYFQSVLGYDGVRAGLALLAYTLPTLVVPPLGERLLLHRGPGVVIPLGLSAIGAGFLLMHRAAAGADPDGPTLLLGCLLAGAGLGLTNTPVTNTATASVPAERAGMAAGMDMSARMISLALNIALMGALLLHGVRSGLARAVPGAPDAALDALAEAVAAGNVVTDGIGPAAARQALAQGFAGIMLYGGLAAWALALLGRVVFGARKPAR